MLLTDKMALEKANSIIKESGKKAEIAQHFWIKSDDGSDEDIFCYSVLSKENDFEYPPGILLPLFKRNGEMTDFILPIPA
jgi:hypothetical protein